MTDATWQHRNLIVTVTALASDREQQLAYTTPGCAICDISEDFYTYGVLCYKPENYTVAQTEMIVKLRDLLNAFSDLEQECFNPDVLDYPDWMAIRLAARETLSVFGYALTSLPKSIEIEKGVWSVDIAGHPLKKL